MILGQELSVRETSKQIWLNFEPLRYKQPLFYFTHPTPQL